MKCLTASLVKILAGKGGGMSDPNPRIGLESPIWGFRVCPCDLADAELRTPLSKLVLYSGYEYSSSLFWSSTGSSGNHLGQLCWQNDKYLSYQRHPFVGFNGGLQFGDCCSPSILFPFLCFPFVFQNCKLLWIGTCPLILYTLVMLYIIYTCVYVERLKNLYLKINPENLDQLIHGTIW